MVVVCALEDNFAEMEFLKEELSKITKEVYEWNSPVDDDENPAPGGGGGGHDAKKDDDKPGKKNSTFANLLHKASMIASSSGLLRSVTKLLSIPR